MGTSYSTPTLSPLEQAHHDLSKLPLYDPNNKHKLDDFRALADSQRRLLEAIESRLEHEDRAEQKRQRILWERNCMYENGTLAAHDARVSQAWEQEQQRTAAEDLACRAATKLRGEREAAVEAARRARAEAVKAELAAEAAAGSPRSLWASWSSSAVGAAGALVSPRLKRDGRDQET